MYPILIKLSEATAARRRVPIWLVDATDGLTAETGVTGTPRLSKSGAASAACTNTITEVDATNMPGFYYIELTAAEVNTLGTALLSFKTAATAQWHGVAHVVAYDLYDSVRQGMTALPNAAAEAAGGLYTRGTGAGQINQAANGQVDANVVAMVAAVITAAAIAADAIGASELAADAAQEIADELLKRDIDLVEATAAAHSLCTAILGAVSKIEDDGIGNIKIYQTDGTTVKLTRVVTTDAALNPLKSLGVGT